MAAAKKQRPQLRTSDPSNGPDTILGTPLTIGWVEYLLDSGMNWAAVWEYLVVAKFNRSKKTYTIKQNTDKRPHYYLVTREELIEYIRFCLEAEGYYDEPEQRRYGGGDDPREAQNLRKWIWEKITEFIAIRSAENAAGAYEQYVQNGINAGFRYRDGKWKYLDSPAYKNKAVHSHIAANAHLLADDDE